LPLEYRQEPVLLNTSGGIKNVEAFVGNEPFVAYNGDVLADFPLRPSIERHLRSGNLATLILRSSGGPLHIQFRDGRVTDIRGKLGMAGSRPVNAEQASRLPAGKRAGRPTSSTQPPATTSDPSFLFTGITILSPEIFRYIPAGEVVSIIPVYLGLIRDGEKIGGDVVDEGLWFDLGTRDAYLAAHELLQPGGYQLSYAEAGWPIPVASNSHVASTARLQGACAVGAGASIGEKATLQNCVLWENAVVAPQSRLTRCVVRDGVNVEGAFAETDF